MKAGPKSAVDDRRLSLRTSVTLRIWNR